jgi:Redoxin
MRLVRPHCVIAGRRSGRAGQSPNDCRSTSSCQLLPRVRPSSRKLTVAVFVFERRPQRFRAALVPTDAGCTHRSTRAGISARLHHRPCGVLGLAVGMQNRAADLAGTHRQRLASAAVTVAAACEREPRRPYPRRNKPVRGGLSPLETFCVAAPLGTMGPARPSQPHLAHCTNGTDKKTAREPDEYCRRIARCRITRSQVHPASPDLAVISSAQFRGRALLLNIFPSVDTPMCATSIRTFNERAQANGLSVSCVSKDLPFAQ